MRDKDDSLFLPAVVRPERQQQLLERGTYLSVQRAEWFVEQEDIRVHCKGAGYRDALLHAA